MTKKLSRIEKVVVTILREEKERGSTTRRGATALAVAKLLDHQTIDEWVTPAERLTLFRDKVDKIVHRFLRGPFDVEEYRHLRVPVQQLQIGRLHAWIALHEGPNAIWVPVTKATPEQWGMNYQMKRHKRRQLQAAERIPLDIKLWLEDKGYTCLEDAT